MRNHIRPTETRTVRRGRFAASTVAVVAAVSGLAGILAAPGTAAPPFTLDWASHMRPAAEFDRPSLEDGLLEVDGTGAGEKIALRLQAGQPGILQVDVGDDGSADFSFDRAQITRIAVDGGGGDDTLRMDESNGAFTTTIPTTIGGGGGDDVLAGGAGAETLLGGGGKDSIDGNRGNDIAFMGGGEDTFIWDPGDGSDTVEGQGGNDTMLFNGANIAERVDLTANGDRLRFFRDIAAITMDTHDVEQIDFKALGGADVVTVGDLRGTGVRDVNVDLAAAAGGGDGQPDRVVVNGSAEKDNVKVSGDADAVQVKGLAATVAIRHPEAAADRLEIETFGGKDKVHSLLPAGVIQLVVDGVPAP
jgi:Ca2+-binding RTX toxin-like protein